MDYQIAWGIAVGAGLGLIGCTYYAFRKLPGVRSLVTAVVAVWLLMPWRFDDDPTHLAPAFIVMLFRGLFERDGNASSVMLGLTLATAAVLVAFFLGHALRRFTVTGKRREP